MNGKSSFLTKPFSNLSHRARVILWLRLTTSFLALIFSIILLKAETINLPVSVVNCESTKVAAALYDTLKKSSSAQNSFITTSEIKLLASYIENQIEGTPEKLIQGLHNWCSMGYVSVGINHEQLDQINQENLFQIDTIHPHENVTINCHSSSHKDILDYRNQLSKIGLNIILAYAYDADFSKSDTKSQITYSSNNSANNEVYKRLLQKWKRIANKYETLVAISIGFEVFLLIGLLLYYSQKHPDNQHRSVFTLWIRNGFAVISTVNMLLAIAGVTYLFSLLSAFKNTVENELSSFGVSAERGTGYIVILIFWLCFTVGIFVEVAGPIWFNPRIKKFESTAQKENKTVPKFQPICSSSPRDNTINESYTGHQYDDNLHFNDYEMDSITAQDNPFGSESESETLIKAEAFKEQNFTENQRTLIFDSDSSLASRVTTTLLSDSNREDSAHQNVNDANLSSFSRLTNSNTLRSNSELLYSQRKPPPLSLKAPAHQPSRSLLADLSLVPMSPILLSHGEKGERDNAEGT